MWNKLMKSSSVCLYKLFHYYMPTSICNTDLHQISSHREISQNLLGHITSAFCFWKSFSVCSSKEFVISNFLSKLAFSFSLLDFKSSSLWETSWYYVCFGYTSHWKLCVSISMFSAQVFKQIKNILDLYTGLYKFKKGYQSRSSIIRDKNVDLLIQIPTIFWKGGKIITVSC